MEEYDEILQAISTEGVKQTLQTLFQQLQTSLEAKNKQATTDLWKQVQAQLDAVKQTVDMTAQEKIQKYLETTQAEVDALLSLKQVTKQALNTAAQEIEQSQLPRYKRRRKKIW